MRGARSAVLVRVAAATAALVLAPSARAQFVLGGSVGGVVPVGDLSTYVGTGWQGTASLGVAVPFFPLGLRFEGSYTQFTAKSLGTPTGAAGTFSGDFRAISGSANLVFGTAGPSPIAPYLIGGVGMYNAGCQDPQCTSKSQLGFNGGLGVRLGLATYSIYGEARFVSIANASASGRATYIPLTVGISF